MPSWLQRHCALLLLLQMSRFKWRHHNRCGGTLQSLAIKMLTRLLSQWQCTISQQETVPDFCQPNDWRRRWDLVSRRNVSIEEVSLVCGGRLFHARTGIVLLPQSGEMDDAGERTANWPFHPVCLQVVKTIACWHGLSSHKDTIGATCCRKLGSWSHHHKLNHASR